MPEEDQRCLLGSVAVLHVPLRQGLSLTVKPGWQPANPSTSPVSTLSRVVVTGAHVTTTEVLPEYWNLNSGPHTCSKRFGSLSHITSPNYERLFTHLTPL